MKELVTLSGQIMAETDMAYRFFDGENTVWLPKSYCQWDEDDKEMTMEIWLARDKGLL